MNVEDPRKSKIPARGGDAWLAENQRYLSTEVARMRCLLERRAAGDPITDVERPSWPIEMDRPPALRRVASALGLSAFECDLLLLCAAAELDTRVPALCAAASGDPNRPYPTFSLALSLLPGAHWSALSPAQPLRRWRLLELSGDGPLLSGALRIDERVLHHLAGVDYLDERLAGRVRPVTASAGAADPACVELAQRIISRWQDRQDVEDPRKGTDTPGVQLCGEVQADLEAVAAAAAEFAGAQLHVLRAEDVPADPYERETLARLLDREAVLWPILFLLACDEDPSPAAAALAGALLGPLIVASREPLRTSRPLERFDLRRPQWQPAATARRPSGGSDARPALDSARFAGLAQRIEPLATWGDLVLPHEQIALLRDIAAQLRHVWTVYETWGFARKSNRGLGISALFAGQSGTGKTMAAEVLGNELDRELYRIDLSAVVSKYIGETEKNLRRVFDVAESAGAILLFDEADALFGKRSEVKDSHDRYANIEVSYLLQRMEQYAGLAILTTNFRSALDPAFLRRIRFIVNFPFPDAAQRSEIWRRVFPAEMPRDGIDIARLTRLSVAGGNIRNIAVNAAFLAAEADEPVAMAHLLRAARAEYAKSEKPLSEVELVSRP